MKRFASLLLAALLLTPLLMACGKEDSTADPDLMTGVKAEIDSKKVSDFTLSDKMTEYVLISVKDFGDMVVRLRKDIAPETVSNFQSLVLGNFYDGLTFHRVYPSFMIQGGDPKGDGSGNSSQSIVGEFNANGHENNLLHLRGVISMARSTGYDTASCQFFICHANASSLDGLYASFGYVVAGLSTVDAICKTELTANSGSSDQVNTKPVNPVVITSIRFVTPNTTE